ncbi:conserved hypothetical protein [Ricinus communis]|uniref:Uncharacterized protein n=1 Tax=Ricinus communis TaxID=3988 RepID=B9TBN7_RICCO|nr:conserved hypothetical protein [Ricinus communis]
MRRPGRPVGPVIRGPPDGWRSSSRRRKRRTLAERDRFLSHGARAASSRLIGSPSSWMKTLKLMPVQGAGEGCSYESVKRADAGAAQAIRQWACALLTCEQAANLGACALRACRYQLDIGRHQLVDVLQQECDRIGMSARYRPNGFDIFLAAVRGAIALSILLS